MLAGLLAVTALFGACSSDTDSGAGGADDAIANAVDAADLDARSVELADALRQNGATSLASMVAAVDFDDITESADFTFLAPDDNAFLELTADEMADMLGKPDEIIAILRNHVVAERVDAGQIVELISLESVAGNPLEVTVDGETVTVGGAVVTATDIDAAGGVVHVIDQLIMP